MQNSIIVESNIVRPRAHQLANTINADLGFCAVELGSRIGSSVAPNVIANGKLEGARHAAEALGRLQFELISLEEAERQIGLSRTAFWRFRKRHRVRVLPGRRVNVDDIIDAFTAERGGKRRQIA